MLRVLVLLLLVTVELRWLCRAEDDGSGGGSDLGLGELCNDWDVRLVGENSSYRGIVEVCKDNWWRPICVEELAIQWTKNHVQLVCKQMGFPPSDAVRITYENVSGPYSYTLFCFDGINSLSGCLALESDPACPGMIAGGVICGVPEEERCEEGDVRLVNGTVLNETTVAGRVEVCLRGLWGTISRLERWTSIEASVVCRQLGFNDSDTIPIGVNTLLYGMGNSTQPILAKEIACLGNEANISECDFDSDIFEGHDNDAGVICEAPPGSCTDGDIRQVDIGEFIGLVQVCYTGLWGSVCAENRYWDEIDATVACRQLGFTGVESRDIESVNNQELQNILSGVNCTGSEYRLADCPHNGAARVIAVGCKRALVVCRNETTPDENSTTATTNSTSTPTPTSPDMIAVIVGASVGAIVLLLVLVAVITIISSLTVGRERSIRKKMSYNLENERQAPSVPDYIQMQGRPASNYLIPVSSTNNMDIYSEWREILSNLLLHEDQLVLFDSLGEGAFGRVYKGTMRAEDGTTTEVAIKTVKDMSSMEDINNFVKESILMLGFNHPNVLRLLGVCLDTADHLPLIVLPFMANGDLRSYITSKRDPSVSSIRINHFPQGLDQKMVIGMCLDVAKGMEYLSSSSFVHRDLAARNCMVDAGLHVHIADFGLSRDVYSKDYYRMGTKSMLPVKWMAPESLADNVFTVMSDVWSYGVVCWEVFSLGSTPYPGVGNHEMSDYIAGGHRLKRPRLCPQEMYSIMELCWSENSNNRPNFSKLVMMVEEIVTESQTLHPHYMNVANGTSNGHVLHHP